MTGRALLRIIAATVMLLGMVAVCAWYVSPLVAADPCTVELAVNDGC